MLRNKKMFIILFSFVLFFIMFFSKNVNAFTIQVSDSEIVLPDIPEDVQGKIYCIVQSSYTYYDGDYCLCFYDGDSDGVVCKYNYDGDCKIAFFKDDEPLTMSRYIYRKENAVWNDLGTRPDQSVKGGKILYSNIDVVNTDGTVFFQKAEVEKVVVAPVLKKVEMKKVTTQLIQILPMTLVVVVSLIGFRKAWVLLSKILHQA